ncbi:MAG: hypothetical protein J5622_02485, partial [Firmicutes bacterium]|nr:hypothetical protein [Bacillota bacterium]
MRRPIMVPLCGLALGIFLAGETEILQGMTNTYGKIAEAVMIAICIIAASIFVKRGNGDGTVDKRGRKSGLIKFIIFVQLGIILLTSATVEIERDLECALSDAGGKVSGVITEVDIKQDYVAFVLCCDGYRTLISVYGDN